MSFGPCPFEGERASFIHVYATGPLHNNGSGVGGGGRIRSQISSLATDPCSVTKAVQQAYLEEGEGGLPRAEFVVKFDQKRCEETTVHEEFRVVHQHRIRAESKGGEHFELLARHGLGLRLGWGSHWAAALSFVA
jgi:hypothetical protein